MSFKMGRDEITDFALNIAYNAGISLVASAGNRGYDANHYPSTHPRVISVGASGNDYKPWPVTGGVGSNYGEGVIALWAPGKNVLLANKNGGATLTTGTSFAAGYVSGVLAIFYGAEGKAMNPGLALTRLMAQTDPWMTFPSGTDWKKAAAAFANTGNRKGAKLNPPRQYLGGPPTARQGC
ncbi:subtilisin-like protein [Tothia fuscella]|uniref:Subtilisin-like protein n=1 Tax=Tothia fuscella TaxID=1048955 RepID=A0A9P4TT80_9PEZI|nr:subtilisin-like protein [Tothia fuscella]